MGERGCRGRTPSGALRGSVPVARAALASPRGQPQPHEHGLPREPGVSLVDVEVGLVQDEASP